MERWEGRDALVTGASSGFGEDIAKRLTECGMKVIDCARNIEKALADALKDAKGSLTAIKCDVSKEEDVLAMFEQIKKEYGGVDVCVNNVGLAHDAPLLTGQQINGGICLNMAAHRVFPDAPYMHCYSATKYSVKAITEGMRNELYDAKTHIRVTHISPGAAGTDFLNRMFKDSPEEPAVKWVGVEMLTCGDITESVIYALSAPGRVQVHDILIRPVDFKN